MSSVPKGHSTIRRMLKVSERDLTSGSPSHLAKELADCCVVASIRGHLSLSMCLDQPGTSSKDLTTGMSSVIALVWIECL